MAEQDSRIQTPPLKRGQDYIIFKDMPTTTFCSFYYSLVLWEAAINMGIFDIAAAKLWYILFVNTVTL